MYTIRHSLAIGAGATGVRWYIEHQWHDRCDTCRLTGGRSSRYGFVDEGVDHYWGCLLL